MESAQGLLTTGLKIEVLNDAIVHKQELGGSKLDHYVTLLI